MGIAERKHRARADRETRIVEAARVIAEREGWPAVTIRRLADEIEYSQPVLYSHFRTRDDIVAAVAVEGFRQITDALRNAAGRSTGANALKKVALAYLDFARDRPALYQAMFTLPTALKFGQADTRRELRAAFDVLSTAVAPFCADAAITAETLWAALHGHAELQRSGRIRSSARDQRIALVVRAIAGTATAN